ncbi:hypothetical protein C2845_PM17G06620 [Panicum miliaceum]|uniref:Uncharacterized protein n=1 Tax=Panicum miliaceum TaxID=4540 RepID=A0A3L6Q4B7_PANMI|nr:hypothetical protein C2845_PM17G06620 [Panicum miliaceum]
MFGETDENAKHVPYKVTTSSSRAGTNLDDMHNNDNGKNSDDNNDYNMDDYDGCDADDGCDDIGYDDNIMLAAKKLT